MLRVAVAICVPVLALAQSRAGVGSRPLGGITRSPGALGGNFGASASRPFGGIEMPGSALTAAQQALQPRPAAPPPGRTGYGYVGPVYYVPNAADLAQIVDEANSHQGGGAYHPANPPPPIPQPRASGGGVQFSSAPPQPQTVIVNNYYGRDSGKTSDSSDSQPEPPRDYYLIAYKNRNIVAAQAYWIDGDTLNYVTSEKAHNQSSLALIDLELTRRLNSDREVPFTVPVK